jgi:DNA-binding transcriptional ArsR family regulator
LPQQVLLDWREAAAGTSIAHPEAGSMAEDTFLEALTALESTLADNQQRTTLIRRRIAQLRRLRSQGAPYAEIVSTSDGPLIVQLLTESSAALDISGASVRRAEARALYAEGLTMDQIAERFGVTRQRVSALLRKTRE